MAENNNLIPTEPDWDGTPLSRAEEILYSIIHTEEWDGTPMSRGEYFLVQLKDAIENISMMDIKGTVPTVADLPATGNKKGDVYSVGPDEQLNKPEYYWDGEAWQYLGQIVDLSGYLALTGGTMTGDLNFSIGGKTIKIGVSGNETQIISTNADGPLIIASKDMLLQSRSGCIELQAGTSQPAISINRNGQSETKIYGNSSAEIGSSWETTVNSNRKTTIKGHRSNNTDTNTITLDSTGITETTLAKKVVTTATGIELGTTSVDNTVSVSTPLKKLSVTSPVQMDVTSGGNLNATGYGNVSVTATAGNLTETANGNTTLAANNGSSTIFGKQGVAISAGATGSSIGYVTATHGATVPASDSSNKVATTAFVHSITDPIEGTYHLVDQNNSASNMDYRVLLSSLANDTSTYGETNKSGNLTFNPSTKALTATDGKLYMKSTNVEMAVNPQSTTQSNCQILYTDNNGTNLFRIQHQTITSGTKQVIFEVFNTDSGGNTVSNRFTLTVSRAGVCTYTIKDPARFCDAIGLGSVLQDISNIQATIGDINTVLEEVL